MSLLILSAADVRQVVSSFDTNFLQDLMARVFTSISRAEVNSTSGEASIQAPHRTAINMASHTTLFMPARIPDPRSSLEGTSIKVVSVPRRQGDVRGLPATTLVMNEDTGAVDAVVNARELTALRNAAGSLLSTTLVGVNKPENIVLFGAGKQIESHINVFLRHFRSMKTCTIVNRTLNERALDLYRSATEAFPRVTFHLISQLETDSIRKAVQEANIIICATPSTSPLFPSSWVASGTHVVLVGSYTSVMQEVEEVLVKRAIPTAHPNASKRIDQVLLVDSREACMKEAGDLIKAGIDQASMLEVGELILQKGGEGPTEMSSPSVESIPMDFAGPVTMFKSVGVGLQDVVMSKEVVSYAKNSVGTGTLIEHYDAAY
ncbi:Ketimine reductase mu-crystallin [Leucoagaricus sp. SymC.cos]|nr:Ketimine reductase mu-crystallin [Leucoagaricus sp. SymC.cos]